MNESRLRRALRDLIRRAPAALGRSGRAAARRERTLIAVALAAMILLIGSLFAIHVIVSTRTLRNWVNTSPEELLLDYDSGSAWVPGFIRIRGLTMRGSDPNVQWFFRMENVTISVSLLDLLRKRFHATRVHADGLVFRLREREAKGELSAAHLARLPKIPGFADPPLTPEKVPPPPSRPQASRQYWSVLIENFVADPASDIWIEIYRFRGHARLTGGFFLHPHTEAWVGPAAVNFLSGAFALAPDQPMLVSTSGRADCFIEPYSQDEITGEQIWRKISGSIRLEGKLQDLRFLNHFLRHSPRPRLEGSAETAHFDVRFANGIGKGRADFGDTRVVARYGQQSLTGRASGRLEVPRWDVVRNDMEIAGSRIELSEIATEGTKHDERDWWGRFDIVSGRIGNGFTARTAVHCRDARPLYVLTQANLPGWAQGILKLDGLNGSARVRFAKDLVEVRDLDASGGQFHVAGEYREERERRRGAFLVETGPLAVGIAIDGAASHLKLLGARKWFHEATAGGASQPAAAVQ